MVIMYINEAFIMEIVYNRNRCNCIQREEIAFLRFAAYRLAEKKTLHFGQAVIEYRQNFIAFVACVGFRHGVRWTRECSQNLQRQPALYMQDLPLF